MIKPFFIIGTERSGTNLLRMILNFGPDVCVPHPPHFLKNLASLEASFGPLSNDQNLRKLIRACLSYLKLHPYQWDLDVSIEEVVKALKSSAYPVSLLGIQSVLYDLYTLREGKSRWGCKSTFSVRHIHEIKKTIPDALFIHLVRDPRDVCVSATKSQFNHYHPIFTSRLWQEEQVLARTARDLYPDSYHLIRYEDLIENPSEITQRVCTFLQIEYHESMLEYHQGSEAQKSSSLSKSWKNTGREVLKSNSGMYSRALTMKEVSLIESQCYPLMNDYQYSLTADLIALERLRVKYSKGLPLIFYLSEYFQMIRMQLSLFKSDKNNDLRIAKYWFVKGLKIRHKFFGAKGAS